MAHAALGCPEDAGQEWARVLEIYLQLQHHFMVGITLAYKWQALTLPYFADNRTARAAVSREADALQRNLRGLHDFETGSMASMPSLAIRATYGEWGTDH